MTNVYNGRGERVMKLPGDGLGAGGTLRYLYDEAGRLIAEQRQSGINLPVLRQQYVWLEDRPVALMRSAYANETLHVHSDHLGTPRAVTRPAAGNAVVWRWPLTGAVFGEDAPDENPDGDATSLTLNLRFPGQYSDSESGLHYNYFRDYEPGTGRYVESDPIGLRGGLSSYGYAHQRPTSIFDPHGAQSRLLYCSASSQGLGIACGPTPPPSPAFDPPSRATCSGYWRQVNDLFLPGWTNATGHCRCVWLCVPCQGPYSWSGDPDDPTLPRTNGQAGGNSAGGGRGGRFGSGGMYSKKRGGLEPGFCVCPTPSTTKPCDTCN